MATFFLEKKSKGHCFIFLSLPKHHNSMINTFAFSFSSFLHITNIFLTILSKIKTQKTRVIYTRARVYMHKLLFDHEYRKCFFFKDLLAYISSSKIYEWRSTNTIRLTKSRIYWWRERKKKETNLFVKNIHRIDFLFSPHLRRQIANDQKQQSFLRILRLK